MKNIISIVLSIYLHYYELLLRICDALHMTMYNVYIIYMYTSP